MHDYIKQLYEEASKNGSPLIRAMFYEFPEDSKCWELQDQYMFGSDYLVAPIFHLNQFEREVYLQLESGKIQETIRFTMVARQSPQTHRLIRCQYLNAFNFFIQKVENSFAPPLFIVSLFNDDIKSRCFILFKIDTSHST